MAGRLLGLGALVFVVAACGAEAVPPDQVGAAGEATKAAGSARVSTVTRFSAGAQAHEFRSTATVDYANDRRTYVDETSGCASITIGDVSYSQVPSSDGMPDRKRWVAYRAEGGDSEQVFEQSREQTTSEDGTTVSGTIQLFATPDPAPADYLDYLRESSGEPERVGEEDVRGVPTTRYRTTLDRRRVLRKELEADGWKAVNIERYLETMVATEEAIDIWVDAKGLARRIVTTTSTEGFQGLAGSDIVTTTEYFDFGVEVAIEPPPAAEVMDSEEWQRIMEEQMREQLDEYRAEIDEGISPLPGAFEPSTLPSPDSRPTACLH